MKHAALLLPLLLILGCSPDGGGGSSSGPSGNYFDYAGTFVTDVAYTFTDSEGAEEEDAFTFNMLIQQNGPAVMVSSILGVADEAGVSFGHTVSTIDYWTASQYTMTFSGASEADDPFTINLLIEGSYVDLAYDYAYDYVLTIGDEIPYE